MLGPFVDEFGRVNIATNNSCINSGPHQNIPQRSRGKVLPEPLLSRLYAMTNAKPPQVYRLNCVEFFLRRLIIFRFECLSYIYLYSNAHVPIVPASILVLATSGSQNK